MNDIEYLMTMRSNVERSQGHIEKQHEIIEQLTLHGHTDMADRARDLLSTMDGHLRTEIDTLARLEAKAATAP